MKSFLCVFLAFLSVSLSQTTPHIQEVFLGKCYTKNTNGNCTGLWDAFDTVASMDNSKITDADYDPLFQVANFSTPANSILFWSGTKAFALAVASNDVRFVTVEETWTGFVMNDLSWCGLAGANPPQFDPVGPCYYPTNNTYPCSSDTFCSFTAGRYAGMYSFWSRASKMFAEGASGNITVLLQPQLITIGGVAQYQHSYRNTSIFYQIELPSIITARVTGVTILLLKNETLAPGEKCGSGTLAVLQAEILKKFGYNATCFDEPQDVYNVFCPTGTTSGQCLAATLVYKNSLEIAVAQKDKEKAQYLAWAIAVTVLVGISIGIIVVLIYILTRSK